MIRLFKPTTFTFFQMIIYLNTRLTNEQTVLYNHISFIHLFENIQQNKCLMRY